MIMKHLAIIMVVLSALQLVMNIVAILLPEYIVGDISRDQAFIWMETIPVSDMIPAEVVPVRIGLFHSVIGNQTHKSTREGLTSVFGFALLSTISCFFTLLYALQVAFHCCYQPCGKVCSFLSMKFMAIAKSNTTAGATDITTMAMALYSARDLPGARPGASTILPMVVAVFAFINHFLLEAVQYETMTQRKKKKHAPEEGEAPSKNFDVSPV